MTSYVEVIGDPITHSKSPLIHNFWLERGGIEAEYRSHHVKPDGLAEYVQLRRDDPDWRGCNVTMPHKQAIMPLLDRCDALASRVGAVNTVVREGDALVGYTTDGAGFLEPLDELLADTHLFRMARIIGTGGAARAIVTALADQGFAIVLAGRNEQKARAILDELATNGDHYTAPLDHFAATTDFAFDDREGCCDLVVNASPLGMRGQPGLPFDWSHAPPGSIAYDIVTDPQKTLFLQNAEESDHRTIGGMAMLVGQAAAAFEKFFGVAPDRSADAELIERLTA